MKTLTIEVDDIQHLMMLTLTLRVRAKKFLEAYEEQQMLKQREKDRKWRKDSISLPDNVVEGYMDSFHWFNKLADDLDEQFDVNTNVTKESLN